METEIKQPIEVGKYRIKEIENRVYRVFNIETLSGYTVDMGKKLCECESFIPDKQQKGERCKHMDMIMDNFQKEQEIDKRLTQYVESEIKDKNSDESGEDTQKQMIIFERRDEEQIVKESILGNVLKEYIYDFRSGGRNVTGLSYAGVKHIAMTMGGIHVGEPVVEEKGDNWMVKVSATDIIKNLRVWGISLQPKIMKLQSGARLEDSFALQKALSKAVRNAIRSLIPEPLIIAEINEWRKTAKKMG